jgi:hypothetical protein
MADLEPDLLVDGFDALTPEAIARLLTQTAGRLASARALP